MYGSTYICSSDAHPRSPLGPPPPRSRLHPCPRILQCRHRQRSHPERDDLSRQSYIALPRQHQKSCCPPQPTDASMCEAHAPSTTTSTRPAPCIAASLPGELASAPRASIVSPVLWFATYGKERTGRTDERAVSNRTDALGTRSISATRFGAEIKSVFSTCCSPNHGDMALTPKTERSEFSHSASGT